MRIALTIIVAIVVGVIPLTGSAEEERNVAAKFNGELTFLEVELPPITISGELAFAGDRLKVSFTQSFTNEEVIVHVDFAHGKATVLYPDTLNGREADLAAMHGEYFEHLREVISTPLDEAPPGWELVRKGTTTIEGDEHERLELTGPLGTTIDCLVDPKGIPLSIEVSTAKWLFITDLSEVGFEAIPPGTFEYDAELYAIQSWDAEDDASLPPV